MGIDDEEFAVLVVEETVAHELEVMVMMKKRPMEVVENEEP
jgi:hypothetical protein